MTRARTNHIAGSVDEESDLELAHGSQINIVFFSSVGIYLVCNEYIIQYLHIGLYRMFRKNCVFSQFTATPPSPTSL